MRKADELVRRSLRHRAHMNANRPIHDAAGQCPKGAWALYSPYYYIALDAMHYIYAGRIASGVTWLEDYNYRKGQEAGKSAG